MNEEAMNGTFNPARPYAIVAMIILCFSFALFFIQFARRLVNSVFWKVAIQISGSLSMLFAIFIFTEYHDLMTSLSSLIGAIAVIGVIRTVYQSKMTLFKISGILCILLLALNNLIYYSHQFIGYLPLIQKITFALVLVWIVGLNFKLILKKPSKLNLE